MAQPRLTTPRLWSTCRKPSLPTILGTGSPLDFTLTLFTQRYGAAMILDWYYLIYFLKNTYPGVVVSNSTIEMINTFLDWAQEQQDGDSLSFCLNRSLISA
jgi:hypothetical protein